jgi:hypothetical protein
MRDEKADRAGVLRAIARLIEAQGLDDLFDGAGADAGVLHAILADVATGRRGRWRATLSRAARRRGLAASAITDRAAMFLAALEARRRDDLYRVLGVPPLASEAALRERWMQVSRTMHPRAGGDPDRFRAVRVAWDALRDPVRRVEYERWWVRALGPLETALAQARSHSGGGTSAPGAPDAASAVSAGSVAASNASPSRSGSVSG